MLFLQQFWEMMTHIQSQQSKILSGEPWTSVPKFHMLYHLEAGYKYQLFNHLSFSLTINFYFSTWVVLNSHMFHGTLNTVIILRNTYNLKGLDPIDRMLEELWMEVRDNVQEAWSRPFPRKRNAKSQNGCLRRPYK